jgi:hypothetical protein
MTLRPAQGALLQQIQGRIGALPTVAPVLPLIVNLNEPLPAIEESRSDGTEYTAAHCLILSTVIRLPASDSSSQAER